MGQNPMVGVQHAGAALLRAFTDIVLCTRSSVSLDTMVHHVSYNVSTFVDVVHYSS